MPAAFNPQSLNRYAYVFNNPVNLVDPKGYDIFDDIFKEIKRFFKKNKTLSIVLGLALQLSPFPELHVAGTYLLTQSNTGENILTAEIIAGTIVATYYCGGCGVAVGALVGEAIGGFAAYQAGGNVLAGVVVGGAVGATTGYLAGTIPVETGSIWAQAAKGFAAGAIKGAGAGVTTAYAGGVGDAETILTSAAIGAAVGGVLGASKPLVFGANITADPNVVTSVRAGETLAGESYSNVTVREGGLWGNAMRVFGIEGQTFGKTILLMPGGRLIGDLIRHELAHVSQYNAFGFVGFLAQYIAWSAQYGYVGNPFEVAARDFAGY